MSNVFGYVILGILGWLALVELLRFRHARHGGDELPYPAARLGRRLLVAGLFAAMVLLAMFWPRTGPGLQIALIGATLLAMLAALGILWFDLHETSIQAVAEAHRLDQLNLLRARPESAPAPSAPENEAAGPPDIGSPTPSNPQNPSKI